MSALLAKRSDEDLSALMANLGGHDMPSLLQAFESREKDPRPTVFIAYTVKGFGLPLQGHKDNHAGLMTEAQMTTFRASNHVREGHEWDRFEGLTLPAARIKDFLKNVPFVQPGAAQIECAVTIHPRRPCPPKTEGLMAPGEASA